MGRKKKPASEKLVGTSVTWDPGLHEAARREAEEIGVSLSKLSEDAMRHALDSKAFMSAVREKVRAADRLSAELERAHETLAKVR